MSVPSAKDKEKLVIDLLKKGYKTREITKLANVSNTTVKKTRQKIKENANEEKNEPKSKPLSVPSQAFKLFLEDKPVV
jgi:transposase